MFDGSMDAKVLVILEKITEEIKESLNRSFTKAGVDLSEVCYCELRDYADIKNHMANILVPVGDKSLSYICGVESLDKWHASIIPATAQFGMRKCCPLYHPERLRKQYGLHSNNLLGATRIKAESIHSKIITPARNCIINPTFSECCSFLKEGIERAHTVSIDIEASAGIINTFGLAMSKDSAMAIRIEPGYHTPEQHHILWGLIRDLLEGPTQKVFQNYIFETLFFSRYGIRVNNVSFDTMLAMKFLNPEFDKGLDNVGRFYTPFPYWKDDSSINHGVFSWDNLLLYNCRDTIGTLYASKEMGQEIRERSLSHNHNTNVLSLMPYVSSACSWGLLVDQGRLLQMISEAKTKLAIDESEVQRFFITKVGYEVNISSPKQIKSALKECGFKIPIVKDAYTGKSGESLNKKSLGKLRKKYPKESVFNSLVRISNEQKLIDTHLNFEFDKQTGAANYMADCNSNEINQWTYDKDPWGRGIDPSRLNSRVKSVFKSEDGYQLIEVKLIQPELHYVAWDSPEVKLMECLQAGGDVNKKIAAKMFSKNEQDLTYKEIQLGHKASRAAIYGTSVRSFVESALSEDDIIITEMEANRIIGGFVSVFPGVKRRNTRIQNQIQTTRKLVTPMGRERFFYDRTSDKLFRDASAYAPKSTVSDILNHLAKYLCNKYPQVRLRVVYFNDLRQDNGILFSCPNEFVSEVGADLILNEWFPDITLAGGKLNIPIDIFYGDRWFPMQRL